MEWYDILDYFVSFDSDCKLIIKSIPGPSGAQEVVLKKGETLFF